MRAITNNNETPTSFNKFKPPENDKTDSKIHEERKKRVKDTAIINHKNIRNLQKMN